MNVKSMRVVSKGTTYILFSFVLWLIVEYLTVWYRTFGEWLSLMPQILLQYLAIILIFYYLLFKRKFPEKKVFIIMLILMYVFELLWNNTLLFNVVWFVPISLLLVSMWGVSYVHSILDCS